MFIEDIQAAAGRRHRERSYRRELLREACSDPIPGRAEVIREGSAGDRPAFGLRRDPHALPGEPDGGEHHFWGAGRFYTIGEQGRVRQTEPAGSGPQIGGTDFGASGPVGWMGSPMNGRLPELEVTVEEIRQVLFTALDLDPLDEQLDSAEKVRDVVAFDSVAVLQFLVTFKAKFVISLEEDWLELDRLTDLPALARYIGQRREAAAGPAAGHSEQ